MTAAPRDGRFRGLLLATAALTAVVIYLVWWQTYAGIHVGQRYRQLPAGQAGTQNGSSVRLLSLTRADRLTDSEGGDPQAPDPGAVWVVAELEATVPGSTEDFYCVQTLVGDDEQVWETTTPRVERTVSYCDSDKVSTGRPYRFEAVFEVPDAAAGQVVGIALDDSGTPARTPVITPPG